MVDLALLWQVATGCGAVQVAWKERRVLERAMCMGTCNENRFEV